MKLWQCKRKTKLKEKVKRTEGRHVYFVGTSYLDWVFSLINFSIASALSSEKLELSEQKKTDTGI